MHQALYHPQREQTSIYGSVRLNFIDSFNFFPCALAKMSAAFRLSEFKKRYFPIFFNKEENQHYVGPYLVAH
jgi:hypothetical protein